MISIILVAASTYSVLNILSGEKGVLYRIPFLSEINPYNTELMHFLQVILVIFAGFLMVHADTTPLYIGLEIMASLNILNQVMICAEKDVEKLKNILKFLARRHYDIVKNINACNDAINIMSFTYLLTTAVILPLVFTFIRINSGYLIGYLIIVIVWGELLLLCLFGEFIKIKTEILSETLYMTNWYDLNQDDKKIFLLILGMMQRSSGFKAAGMYNINMLTFIQVLWFFERIISIIFIKIIYLY